MSIETILKDFARTVQQSFQAQANLNPEEQLKSPIAQLLKDAGAHFGFQVIALPEAQVAQFRVRPDIAVLTSNLLTGYVELKAPGKGAEPTLLTSRHDRDQWEKLKNIPNLIYCDGNQWGLFRSGQRVGALIHLGGNITENGARAINAQNAKDLESLLRNFFSWSPIVPDTPKLLAKHLAPLVRLLRDEVIDVLANPGSNLAMLAEDWRRYLFPGADDAEFADSYAQTLTYALLLARFTDASATISTAKASQTLRSGHVLLADALGILAHPQARSELKTSVDLVERIIDAVDAERLNQYAQDEGGDPWLYFYEDFLAEYDPKKRKDWGVYYTPVQVVNFQVRLVGELLREKFGKEYTFADKDVTTLDPAAGTGTYPLAALEHGLKSIAAQRGAGMLASASTRAAENMYAFETLVGPYTVAHLRISQRIQQAGGSLPADGVHVYLTDTLESPNQPPPSMPMTYKALGDEHERARKVKANTPILVCIGNPPYDRQHIELSQQDDVRRKGGWIRFGDEQQGENAKVPFDDFLEPLKRLGLGQHAKNLYNDYVYFWRWALWKVFENKTGGGIVSFITASSYLRGPGFAGMRGMMRQIFDELWIIDLEGDNLGARISQNVFAIQTPVAIAIGVRYGMGNSSTPATAHYVRVDGTRQEKLAWLDGIHSEESIEWSDCLDGRHDPLLPATGSNYQHWPLVTDIFPWQENGLQFKRTWPIGETREVLQERWEKLLGATGAQKKEMFRETEARTIEKKADDPMTGVKLPALSSLRPSAPVQIARYAYRSFDRQWTLFDVRLCDRPRPNLLKAHSNQQVYMTSLLSEVLGQGPAAVAAGLLPDLHHFRGSFGGKHVIPLWRDKQASAPNILDGLLDILSQAYGTAIRADDVFAYAYALLASPEYVRIFWDELTIPGPRLPLTKNSDTFSQAAEIGKKLIWLHTYGERFVPPGTVPGKIPPAKARCLRGTPTSPQDYPRNFLYDTETEILHVGSGEFGPVPPAVWSFSVSGLQVLKSWLDYRKAQGAGKKSSPLDSIRPKSWQFDDELLDLIWVLEHTIAIQPELKQVLEVVIRGEVFAASELPEVDRSTRAGLGQLSFGFDT